MKIRPHAPVYPLTYLTIVAGIIVIGTTHYNEISIYQSLGPVINAFGKLKFDLLLLLYSVFALFMFAILRARTGKISKPEKIKTEQRSFRYIVIGSILVIILFIYLLAEIWRIDLLAQAEHIATKIEAPRIHSWLLLLSSVLTAALADVLRINREEKLKQAERRYTLQITMRTVQDIVGNFMNSIQLYRIKAEESGALDKDSLSELDKLIFTTSDRINTLATLKYVAGKEISSDMYVLDTDERHTLDAEPGK